MRVTPERIAELRARWCAPRNEGLLISAEVAEMLREIERMQTGPVLSLPHRFTHDGETCWVAVEDVKP